MDDRKPIVVEKRININAAPESVWPLISTPEGFRRWFMPGDVKPLAGHEFHLNTPFGDAPCRVVSADRPRKIVFTWGTLGILSYPHWTITLELKPVGSATELILRHEGWSGEDDAAIREKMSGGWEKIVEKLAREAVAG
jgi:uncharacterized protein YndB with AHSA1/START domain